MWGHPEKGGLLTATGQAGPHSASVLDEIVAQVRIDIDARQRQIPLAEVRKQAAGRVPARDAYPCCGAPE
jgi:indole-3-glycerol phosphate synthase